eukprot:s5023_g1.t1
MIVADTKANLLRWWIHPKHCRLRRPSAVTMACLAKPQRNRMVPTELPSPATSVVEGTVEVPTAPDVMELPPRPELGESAIFASPEMAVPRQDVVPTEMPTSPIASPQDPTEAVTGDTRTLRTNVPTVSGDEWRARMEVNALWSGWIKSGYDPTVEVTTDEPPLLVPGLHSSAFVGPGSSAPPESPSEMPVPTEMPTSPVSDLGDYTVPTAPTRVEPTVLGGVPPTAEVDEVPVLPRSSGMVSSVGASSPTEADIAVPTEKPTFLMCRRGSALCLNHRLQ